MSRKGLRNVQQLKNGVKWKVEDMKILISQTLRGVSAKEMVHGPRKADFLRAWSVRQVSSKISELRKQNFLPPKNIEVQGFSTSTTTPIRKKSGGYSSEEDSEEEETKKKQKKKKKKQKNFRKRSNRISGDEDDDDEDEDEDEEAEEDFDLPNDNNDKVEEDFATPTYSRYSNHQTQLFGTPVEQMVRPPPVELPLMNKVKDPVKGSVIVRVTQFAKGVHQPHLVESPVSGYPYFDMNVDATPISKDEDLMPYEKGVDYESSIGVMNKFAQNDQPEYAEGGICGKKRYRVHFNEKGASEFTVRDTGDYYVIKYGYESEFMETPTKKVCQNPVGLKVK